ncbi:hypothetical protein BKA82DRAFT_1008097 [Pisolithus tinctorius]|uniref:Uncharacterized protein n=1 Tax=Pisolithus tinctorius Marx 270 TaxID=870435 RepID=A0A0C3JAM2_PISTI|nr:hypothetical protein BKA82DRAFT_1008097 [Pisolithus tinctorius]KIN94721.1 hypothetical protein M404DRAFT_1008097 [Pisolithus tinctorius Marx 270]
MIWTQGADISAKNGAIAAPNTAPEIRGSARRNLEIRRYKASATWSRRGVRTRDTLMVKF